MKRRSRGNPVHKLLIWDFDGTLGYREGGAWTATLYEVLRQATPGAAHSRTGVAIANSAVARGLATGDAGIRGALTRDAAVPEDDTYETLRAYMQAGFPWQTPERAHPELDTPDAWWAALLPVFERAYRGLGFSEAQARDLASQVRSTYLDSARWRVYDDVRPVLRLLADAGWAHALLTNHVPELPRILDALGLTSCFAGIFNSAQLGYEKPNPHAYQAVLETFESPKMCWMIGDSIRADVRGAEAAGIAGILVRRAPGKDVRYYAETLWEVVRIVNAVSPTGEEVVGTPTDRSERQS